MKEIRPKNFVEPKAPFSYGILTQPHLFLAGQTPINERCEIVGIGDFELKRDKCLKT